MKNEELIELIKAGINTRKNMAELYVQNRGFIWNQTIKYQGLVEMDDIMQEAYIVLDKAVKSYDPSRGSFVSWLGHYIGYVMPRSISALYDIHIPVYMIDMLNNLRRFSNAYKQNVGHKPSDKEIMDSLGLSEKQLRYARTIERVLSKEYLSEPINDDNTLEELIPDDANLYDSIEDSIDDGLYSEILTDALSVLTDKQREIVKLRMNGLSMSEVCDRLAIKHTQQVSTAERVSIKKIRKWLQERGLLTMLYEDAYRGSLSSFRKTLTSTPERIAIKEVLLASK